MPDPEDVSVEPVGIINHENLANSLFASLDFIYKQSLMLIENEFYIAETEVNIQDRQKLNSSIFKHLLSDDALRGLALKQPSLRAKFTAVLDVPESMRKATAKMAITIYQAWMNLWQKHTNCNFDHPVMWTLDTVLIDKSDAWCMPTGTYKDLLCLQSIHGNHVPDKLPTRGVVLYRYPNNHRYPNNQFAFQNPINRKKGYLLPPSLVHQWGFDVAHGHTRFFDMENKFF